MNNRNATFLTTPASVAASHSTIFMSCRDPAHLLLSATGAGSSARMASPPSVDALKSRTSPYHAGLAMLEHLKASLIQAPAHACIQKQW